MYLCACALTITERQPDWLITGKGDLPDTSQASVPKYTHFQDVSDQECLTNSLQALLSTVHTEGQAARQAVIVWPCQQPWDWQQWTIQRGHDEM